VNKVLLQEINQLIGIKLLTSSFLNIFGSLSQFPGGTNARLPPPDALMKLSHRISLKSKMSLKTILSGLATLLHRLLVNPALHAWQGLLFNSTLPVISPRFFKNSSAVPVTHQHVVVILLFS